MHNQFKTQKFKHLMLAMGPRDLNSAPYSSVHCSSHSMTIFQSSELTELMVVENSQLFAQRAHSARYAPFTCTMLVHMGGGGGSARLVSFGTHAKASLNPIDCLQDACPDVAPLLSFSCASSASL